MSIQNLHTALFIISKFGSGQGGFQEVSGYTIISSTKEKGKKKKTLKPLKDMEEIKIYSTK